MDTELFFTRLFEIAQRYGLETDGLPAAEGALSEFCAAVPVIGPFNAGKSALLNALLGMQLLPCAITAQTSVPTELVWASSCQVLAFQGEHTRRLDVGALRSGEPAELAGVERLQISAPAPVLQELAPLRLVDMPGLDSGLPGCTQALRAYLPHSLGYVLVFSADEPVIKRSVSSFLADLQLRDTPLIVLLSKCDKHPEAACREAKAYLEHCLDTQLGIPGTKVHCVCAGATPDITPLRRALEALREQALAARAQSAGRLALRRAEAVRAYLRQRIASDAHDCGAADSGLRRLERERTVVKAALTQNALYFEQACASALEEAASRCEKELPAAMRNIGDLQSAGMDPAPYADSVLRALIGACARSELDPVLAACVRSLPYVLALPEDVCQVSADTVSCREQALALFPGCARLLERAPVSSELSGLVLDCLGKAARTQLQAVAEQAAAPVWDTLAARQRALEGAGAQPVRDAAAEAQMLADLERDLDDVEAILFRLRRPDTPQREEAL